MRLLFVVQRYGHEVFGGAEFACRQFATHLAPAHDVEVLTTCAVSYVDWANSYAPGTETLDGIRVHRLPVDHPREHRFFGPLNARVVWSHKPVPQYLQREWMRVQGPLVPDLTPWLWDKAPSYDVVVFFTYLYYTTWAGLPVASGRSVPTVLHPTAHDEPMLYLQLFDTMFRHPTALGFLTEEESNLVGRRFRVRQRSIVTGIGTETEVQTDESCFRGAFGLGDRPYLLYLGRVDPSKGSDELFDFFRYYKQRNPGPLALVIVGEPVKPPPPHPDVVLTGFVDDTVKQSAIAGAFALVQPSYFESFSMALTESWAHRKPALVQGACDVLVGQVRRSGGGIPYRGFAEFEAALDMLIADPTLARSLGEAGFAYTEQHYRWDHFLARYERFLGEVAETAAQPV
jgi:glycosyltransferase involved in cell wall biosynthesis